MSTDMMNDNAPMGHSRGESGTIN